MIRSNNRITTYFLSEKKVLFAITISGLIYNIGMIAGPWFEGALAQRLYDVITQKKRFKDMVTMAVVYIFTIAFVQFARFIKRYYVRRFGNNVNRRMKLSIYEGLVHKSKTKSDAESTGSIMTKAISDADACSEGMRKFTTEVFDTGIVMIAYIVMLFSYDWRLSLICCAFPPFAYLIAEKMKVIIHHYNAEYKKSAERLNEATLDRTGMALTYRINGCEKNCDENYDKYLTDYERTAVKANMWGNIMQPVYQIISMIGVFFIIWFGGKNVVGDGWRNWNIAAFTTFLSCFVKLAVKSSKAAKLFNAVQKAQVSWKRIKPLLTNETSDNSKEDIVRGELKVNDVSVCLNGSKILNHMSFEAMPGQIIGVTGQVASGKSVLGKIFLNEFEYDGQIKYNGRDIKKYKGLTAYSGHDMELLTDTIKENILLGDSKDVWYYLKKACIDDEVKKMPEGIYTLTNNGGVTLSGGQQARIAFARTLCHIRPVIVLDDPFSAVDKDTEQQLFANLKEEMKDSIVIFISHRLTLFPKMEGEIWLENGNAVFSNHESLLKNNKEYASLYLSQMGGIIDEQS